MCVCVCVCARVCVCGGGGANEVMVVWVLGGAVTHATVGVSLNKGTCPERKIGH